MTTIAHRDLRNNSSEILRRVAAGESFEVTNNGNVVALLVPAPEDKFERLVRTGQVRPPSDPGSFADIPRISGPSSRELLDDVRGQW